jgi:type IV secretion system protein VirB9
MRTAIIVLGLALSACAHQRGYAIEGVASWKPTRIYRDGPRTVIEVPRVVQAMKAPPALLLQAGASLRGDHPLVTYKILARGADTHYVVDGAFDSAVMIAGVGRTQERVDITRME